MAGVSWWDSRNTQRKSLPLSNTLQLDYKVKVPELHQLPVKFVPSQNWQKCPPLLAIDVGANKGRFTRELLKVYPNLEVHLFEPSKTNVQILNEAFMNSPNCKIVPAGLSNVSTQATLYSNQPGSGLGSLTKRKLDHFNIDFKFTESIQLIRFDEYWVENLSQRPIDFIKLDIEGHELDALEGMVDALKKTRIVQFEFGGCNIDTRTFFQDYWFFFRERGFDLYRVTALGPIRIKKYSERLEYFTATNYVAVSKKP